MPTDTVPSDVTAVTAPHIPVFTSGAQAISTARAFAASIADGVIERDRSGALPVRELAALDASGLLAITVPRQHHGAEVPATVLAEVIRTIAAVDPAIAQVPQGHFLLVDVLAVLGTPGQRRRLFAKVLRGGRLGNGLAERGGLHAQDLKTRLSGASAADERYDLSRHWRNARTHASHDPVAWKYHHVGNYLLNDVLPPNHGQI